MALKKWVSKGEGIKNWEKGEFASSTSMKVLKPLCMIYVYAKFLKSESSISHFINTCSNDKHMFSHLFLNNILLLRTICGLNVFWSDGV